MNCSDRSDYVDQWYSQIEPLTFSTFFIRFTVAEARTLLAAIKHQLDRNPKKQPLSPGVTAALNAFSTRVDSEISFPPKTRFFARLGSRSPKDATLHCYSGKMRFKNAVKERYAKQARETSAEKWVIAPVDYSECELSVWAENEGMACTSARDIFDLFLNSERIRDDLIRELNFPEPKLVIVVREWDERIHPLYEFRGFVSKHKLRALTQYDTRWFVEEVFARKDEICESIVKYFNTQVCPRLSGKGSPFAKGKYCVDFAVIMGKPIEVRVVELNQLSETTGLGLFDLDEDRDVLKGRDPFEFRILEEWPMSPSDVKCWLSGQYLEIRNKLRNEVYIEVRANKPR
jgi:hypothetical protein